MTGGKKHPTLLNNVFQALADPTRRAVLGRLSRGPAAITELATPFDMALPSFMKHIRYLEGSGLIRTRKEGRVRTCAIRRKNFVVAEEWFSEQRAIWEGRADRLEQFVATVKIKENRNDSKIGDGVRPDHLTHYPRAAVTRLERLGGPGQTRKTRLS